MPYVSPLRRSELDAGGLPINTGELNYKLTRLCLETFEAWGQVGFAARADVHSALTTAAAEWYRRMIAPYEDAKCRENGDVYP